MSMISEMHWQWTEKKGSHKLGKATLFYSTRVDDEAVDPKKIPFLDRLLRFENDLGGKLSLTLFITGRYEKLEEPEQLSWHYTRRIEKGDLLRALGDVETRKRTLCYVCGPPAMTDEFVEFLNSLNGLEPSRVLCEKWW
jgi:NAD(P)H-flavin reductase